MRLDSLYAIRCHGGAAARRRPRIARPSITGLLAAIGTAACLAASSAHAATLYSQYDSFPALSPAVATPSYATPASVKVALDDFVVPAGRRWTIDGVDVRGTSADGSLPSGGFAIWIYRYAVNPWTGGPGIGDQVASTYVAPAAGSTSSDLRFNVRAGSLPSGRYWLALAGSSPWSWADRTGQSGLPAAWTSGALSPVYVPTAIRCVNGVLGYRGADCHIDPRNPDQVFRLRGTSVTG